MTTRTQRGFTLIELLIVVAIIAIITGIAVPNLMKAFFQAKDKKVMTEMRNFAVAIGIYRIDVEMIPRTNDMTVLVNTLKGYQNQDGDLLQISEHDGWGHLFYYSGVSQDDYTLKSFGRDGTPGTVAGTDVFDANADTIIISGVFIASHEGATVVVGH